MMNCISSDDSLNIVSNPTDCHFNIATANIFTDAASGDFSLPSNSYARDRGVSMVGFTPDSDIAGIYRDSVLDVGAYEYDTGLTGPLTPASVTISADVSLVGAEVRIYDLDGLDGDYGTELAGEESCPTPTYEYTNLIGNTIVIQIMLTGYEEFVLEYELANESATLPIKLIKDINL